jgi:2-haloacid dehalogenase
MFQAVMLDVYGTLVHDDSEAGAVAAVAGPAGLDPAVVAAEWDARIWALADSAYGPGFLTLAELNRRSLTGTAAHFGVTVDVPAICRRLRDSGARAPLYADSRPFLASVDVPVCLVSDVDRDVLDALLERHGITGDLVVTSEDARAYKPRPEPFERALDLLGVAAGEVVHVGDSPAADIAGASALGIATAFVRRGDRRLPAYLRATHTVGSLSEVLHFL